MFNNKLSIAYKNLKLSEEGRLIFEHILTVAKYNRASYVEGKPDATAYNEGKKYYAREVLRLMNFSEKDAQDFKDARKSNIINIKKEL